MIHFVLFFHGDALFPDSTLTFANPGVTAALASLITLATGTALRKVPYCFLLIALSGVQRFRWQCPAVRRKSTHDLTYVSDIEAFL